MKQLIVLLLSAFSYCAGAQTVWVPPPDTTHLSFQELDSLVNLQKADLSRQQKKTAGRFLKSAASGVPVEGHKTFELDESCGLHAVDGKKTLSDLGVTAVKAKETYPDAWRWLTSEKLPTGVPRWTALQADALIVKLSKFDACWVDALWKNSVYLPMEGSRGLLLSENNIVIPKGSYWSTIQTDLAYGNYSGSGNYSTWDQSGQGGTEIHLWHERWNGHPVDRVLMGAFHGGSNSFFAYSEGQQVCNLRLNGEAKTLKDPSMNITGLVAWDTGEGSEYKNLFIHHCDIGLDIVRGTPWTGSGTISLFQNNVAGVTVTGAAGCTVNMTGTWSGDDNSYLIWQRAGWGRPAGGLKYVAGIKAEALITPQRPYKPNGIRLDGWVRTHIASMKWSAAAYTTDLFELNADVNSSHLLVSEMDMGGNERPVQNFVYDRLNKEHYPYDVAWTTEIFGFEWFSWNKGTLYPISPDPSKRDVPMVAQTRACNTGRMGYLPTHPTNGGPQGTYNYEACNPSWNDLLGNSTTGTTPAPCSATWILGTKACTDCIVGKKMCVTPYVSSGACVPNTPKPSDLMNEENCTVPPPGTVVKWDSSVDPATATLATKNTTGLTKVAAAVALGPVTKAEVINLKLAALPTGQGIRYINSQLYVNPQGQVMALGTGFKVHATLTVGQPKSFTVEFPASTLEYVIGSSLSKTALFTGTIKLY